jgi:Domain of unknown function (DUF1844)
MSDTGVPPGQGGPDVGGQPTPEELMAELAARLGRTPVRDVVVQTMATFTDMAGIRLGLGPEGEARRDLSQARLAIEALRALVAVSETHLGAEYARAFREPLTQLQLAYARVAEAAPAGEPADEETGAEPPPPGQAPPPPQPDPASRLWVPPGTRRRK